MANRITTEFSFSERGNGLSKIKADVKEADGLFGKMKAGIKGVSDELKTNRAAQAGMATAAVAAAKVAIDAASNLEESVNAVRTIYKEAGDDVLALGDNSVEAFGMSQRAFNEFAVQFAGYAYDIANDSGRDVVDVVNEMATRVADFASLHNLSLEEASRVAQSTLAGETEAFRRYNGDVSAATVKTYAYAEGIAEAGEELTEGEKKLARYGLFMEQTADVAGDWANTQDEAAGQQKQLRANIEDTAAALGQDLLPIVAEAANIANEAATQFREFDDSVKNLSGGKGSIGMVLDIGTAPLKAMNKYNNAVLGFVGIGKDAEKQTSAWVDEVVALADAMLDEVDVTLDATKATDDHTESVSDLAGEAQLAAMEEYNLQRATDVKAEADRKAEQAADRHRNAVRRLREGVESLKREIDDEQAWLNLQNAMDDTIAKLDDGEASARDQRLAILDLREEVLAYAEAINLPAVITTKLDLLLDQGKVDEVRLLLARWGNGVTVPIKPQVIYTGGNDNASIYVDANGNVRQGPGRARGGDVRPGTMYPVGEGGKPELLESNGQHYLIPGDRGGRVTPAKDGGWAGALHFHNHAPVIGVSDQSVARHFFDMMESYLRNGGQLPPTMQRRLG